MTTLRIAEMAERAGVPTTTLRYYEEIGLLTPAGRSGNGYRAYDERDVQRMRLVTSAKRLDISLDDVSELLQAWDGDDCTGVQARMQQVVTARLAQAQDQIAALTELAVLLRTAAARLSEPAADGPCDLECACFTASSVAVRGAGRPPIACTLEAGQSAGRVAEWQSVLLKARSRQSISGGFALTYDHGAEITIELARLAAAEQACCTFFDFTLAVTSAGLRFEVRAPAEAQDILDAVFAAQEAGV